MAAALGCEGPTGTTAFDLAKARSLWHRNGFDFYELITLQECFCGFTGTVRISVVDGVAGSAIDLVTGERVPVDVLRIGTVEDVFQTIEFYLEQGGTVDVSFDDRLGYPVTGRLDLPDHSDAGFHFEVLSLEPSLSEPL
ncbi:MAG TPA: DUF6174 domain-containing protein [Gemmatimonadota bacterium]|nr:DUF6174 domain-containing protein [Gemmatimonadota bacterium]